ncbi:MAG: peptide/nickel transport system substrate-binding protein [Cyanobium sp.]|uniref:ABC transporter substrate-binding protein n=1 Tax=Synechococcus sp. CS-1331 TaxID=2847973 RepID=UPI00288041ED|nr:ABC transporter substrate-binding protein [Synechococcus sp. CS-1331]
MPRALRLIQWLTRTLIQSPIKKNLAQPIPLALLIGSLGLGLLLSSCRAPRPSHEGIKRLVVASKNRVDTVDPAGGYTFGAMQLLSAIGDPLYAINARGQLEPRLALAPPQLSADGLTARVELRQGVLFHDGTPFNAAAMVFTLERFLAIGKLSYLLGDRVSGVRAVGPYTLELTLNRPFSALAELLSAVNLTPLSPSAYRNHRKSFLNDRFVGTGPYRLSFFTNQQQRLEPFAGYWGVRAANGGIDLVSLSNSTALFGALQSGEVDVLLSTSLEIDQQAALRRSATAGKLQEGSGPALEIGYLTLLTDQPPLNDPRLRQAVAYSLDRATISRRVTLGLRPPLRDLVPPSLKGSDPTAWPSYSPARARALYRQAGYCQGKRLSLPLTFRSNIPADRMFALTWQAQLRQDLGDCVELEVTGMEATTAYRQLGEGAFPLILLEWMGDFPDADNYLVPLLGCEEARGERCLKGASAASGSFWAKPGLQQELERSASLTGPARAAQLRRIQRQTAAANPYLPVWLVAPRAWAQRNVSQPRFDGSGRLLLQELNKP